MKKEQALRIVGDGTPPRAPQPPVDRGRLWYDFQIPDQFLGGLPGIKDQVRWVREHLPRETRIQIGRASAWYDSDVRAHLDRQRGAVA